jgi:hypothetical protein
LVPTERREARLHQARSSPTRCVTFPPRPGSRSKHWRGCLTASTTWQGLGNAPETPMVGRRTIPNAARAFRPARNDDCAIKLQGIRPSDIGRTTGAAGTSSSVRNLTATAMRTLRQPKIYIKRQSPAAMACSAASGRSSRGYSRRHAWVHPSSRNKNGSCRRAGLVPIKCGARCEVARDAAALR